MHIIPLGTNGFLPSFGRQTASYAIPFDRTLIILDAGSGLARLATPEGNALLMEIDRVDLFLTHYHHDHTVGFNSTFDILASKKVTVYGMERKRMHVGITSPGYQAVRRSFLQTSFDWKILGEGVHRVGEYTVAVRRQFHRGKGSLAFRFDFGLAYVTDTEVTRESIEFVRGVPLLLHEHFATGKRLLRRTRTAKPRHFRLGHVTTTGAATVAKEAGVGTLALIHHYPLSSNKRLTKQLAIAQSIFPKTILAQDLQAITF